MNIIRCPNHALGLRRAREARKEAFGIMLLNQFPCRVPA